MVSTVVLSYVQYLGYQAFQSVPDDLGTYNQAFYTTVHSGKFFYYTTNLPGGSTGNLFGTHFVPFFFVLVPFYALASGPLTLVVLKNLGLAAGAIPLYALAKFRLQSRTWAVACAGAYLLTPLITSLDWNGFDPEVFLPVTVLTAMYFLARQQTVLFVGAWLAALSVIEAIAPLLIAFAIFALLIDWWVHRAEPVLPLRGERRLLILGLVVAVLWLGLTFVVISHISPTGGTYGPGYAGRYSDLGARSIPDVIPQAILHPDRAWTALHFQGGTKVGYFVLALACLGFFPLLGEIRSLLTAGVWAFFAFLSNSPGFYSLGTQYPGYLVPFLFVGLVGGLATVRRWSQHYLAAREAREAASDPPLSARSVRLRRRGLASAPLGVLVVAVLATVAVASPLLPQPAAATPYNSFGIAAPSSHQTAVESLLRLIPPTAAVFTTIHLFPQVSSRPNAYVLSDGIAFSGHSTYWGWMQQYINSSDFVLVDYVIDPDDSVFIQYFGNLSQFGVVGGADGAVLYERGWHGAPMVWAPTLSTFAGGDLTLTNAVRSGRWATSYGATLYHAADHRPGVVIWNGPRQSALPPGTYHLSFWFRLLAPTGGNLLRLQLTEMPLKVTPFVFEANSVNHRYHFDVSTNALPPINLDRTNVTAPGPGARWFDANVTVTFNYTKPGSFNEAGIEIAGDVSLYLITMTLAQLPPSG
ncbi:MAG: DUF2079 domain-containing protein [Thermoplasmata archaeon]|nr:DUF2079 domain-containing protein [Thermoplasmata archaeon]